jgi:hemerythrin-like domain-containing protein
MEATEMLMEEHKIIERVLASLELGARRLDEGKTMRAGFFIEAADFVRDFADGCHHKKEEGALFPAMELAGIPKQGGPISVMLEDHEEGRRLIRAMRAAAEKMDAGDASTKSEIAQNAQDYAALMRNHITMENNILFPMADNAMPTGNQVKVAEAFKRINQAATAEGVYQKYLDLAEALERESKA